MTSVELKIDSEDAVDEKKRGGGTQDMNKVQKRQRNTTVIRPFPRRARACECPCPESPHFMDILNTGDMYRFSPQGQSHTEPSGAD